MRKPSPEQRSALYLIYRGHADHGNLPEMVYTAGGGPSAGPLIQRLVDRGWIEYRVTDDGYAEGLGFIRCQGCGQWCDEEDAAHLKHLEPGGCSG